MWVSGKLPTYPFPKPHHLPLTQGKMLTQGRGRWAVSQKPKLISKFHSYQTKEYHGDLHICWCCPRCAAVGCCYFHLVLPEKTKKGGLWVCKVLRAYRLKRELKTRSEQLPCACATAFSRTSLFLERFWRAFWISFKFHKTSQQNLQT